MLSACPNQIRGNNAGAVVDGTIVLSDNTPVLIDMDELPVT
jgi:hypothetical protein